MDGPTAYRNLRGPSPFVLAMRTRRQPSLASTTPTTREAPATAPGLLRLAARATANPHAACAAPASGRANSVASSPTCSKLILLCLLCGEIIPKITALSTINGSMISVLSVLGAVQEVTLLLSSGVTSYHKGPLEIICLFGSILTPNDQGCLRVTLASADSSVIGGVITGPLKAATPVQAVVASFYSDAYRPNRATKITAHYPNSLCTISNGNTLSSECANPGYASCTAADQNESSEVDVKPSLGLLNLTSL